MAVHSFVFPVFNEEDGLHELMKKLEQDLLPGVRSRGDDFEILFVDDGSSDRSFIILKELRARYENQISLLKFARNFGHQTAISAGIDYAKGDTITVMDADLQDPPSAVLKMIDEWKKGADIVYAIREKRLQETWFKKVTAAAFYRILRKSTRLDIPLDTGDFRLMSRRSADVLRKLREQHRFVRGMAKWVGFKESFVHYVREARFAGETKYPLSKMLKLAWDGMTSFSMAPLKLAYSFAIALFAIGLIFLGFSFYCDNSSDFLRLSFLICLVGSVQLISLGLIGEYVGRIFEESKRRPLYVLEEVVGPATSQLISK